MSNLFRLVVSTRPQFPDARGAGLLSDIAALGITSVRDVRVSDLYFLRGELNADAVDDLALRLLHDPVTESCSWFHLADIVAASSHEATGFAHRPGTHMIEVAVRPGVTDSVAETLLTSAQLLGDSGLTQAATAQRYQLEGDLTEPELERVASGLLANSTIQTYQINGPIAPPFVASAVDDTVEIIALRDADDARLLAISKDRRLALDLAEMQAIRGYFRDAGRDPTDVELEMLAQTWSEHCVHKTFKASIDLEMGGETQRIDGLLKSTIRAATETLAKPWVVSAFVDNAGIIRFDERFDLAFKVETHNHPSALEPFGGANTGVGGVVRDVLGVSARPIANTDILCFGRGDMPFEDVPPGVLHPRRVAAGVVAGVGDYGNKMGIPTVNGAILYDPAYTANPLVYCGCLGILPHGAHRSLKEAAAGDLVVVVGGRTGRDGLRGATFSSMEMSHETGLVAGSAVQIGHPIHEKQILEVLLAARDEGLYTAVTDCGAGGLSSAVGEMSETLGADVELADVPLKYAGLRPWEIWLSEAQERMVFAVAEARWPRLLELCKLNDIEATVLGRFTGDGKLTVRHHGQPVVQLDAAFLHGACPRRQLQAVWVPPAAVEPEVPEPSGPELGHWLLRLLADPNIASKEPVVRRYDHEVQGGTVVKPFVGDRNDGPGDAAVLLPLDTLLGREAPDEAAMEAQPGCVLSAGINPWYGQLDPYAMAWACVDEAMRNAVAVGADPDRVAILDNFCWGSPSLPDRLGGLVRCAQGCHDAALAYGTPFVSGKDSLNNEYVGVDGVKRAIPGTLLISALGLLPDATRTATMDLKQPGDWLYIVGETGDEMGGGMYYQLQGQLGANAPQPVREPMPRLRAIHAAIQAGLVRACHDCSEGGLAVAAAEMCIGGRLGLELDLAAVPGTSGLRWDARLFSESLGRFLVEVRAEDAEAFEARMGTDVAFKRIGQVSGDGRLRIADGTTALVSLAVDDLVAAWRGEVRP